MEICLKKEKFLIQFQNYMILIHICNAFAVIFFRQIKMIMINI